MENLASPERGAQIVVVSSNFGSQPNDGCVSAPTHRMWINSKTVEYLTIFILNSGSIHAAQVDSMTA